MQSTRYDLALLLDRRLILFLLVDGFVTLVGLFDALTNGGKVEVVYASSVLMPSLVFGVPAMASVIALERQAGSLDLALSVPLTERFFRRRLLSVSVLLIGQGWLLLLLNYFETAGGLWPAISQLPESGPLLARALLQTVLVNLFLAALILFWAVRLESTAAVMLATVVSLYGFFSWLSVSPKILAEVGEPERFLGIPSPYFAWCWQIAVVSLATTILYLYARYRLRRPETILV